MRRYESESIVAMDINSSMLGYGGTISQIRSTANVLRNEWMEHRNWKFNGDFEDFKNPLLLQFFLTHLLFDRHGHKKSEMRNAEVYK